MKAAQDYCEVEVAELGRAAPVSRGVEWRDGGETALVAAVLRRIFERLNCEDTMRKSVGEKKKPCKNCEGKGTLKKGDKIVRCQRCGGTGIKPS